MLSYCTLNLLADCWKPFNKDFYLEEKLLLNVGNHYDFLLYTHINYIKWMFATILDTKEVWDKITDHCDVKNFELMNKLLYIINTYCRIRICMDIPVDVFLCLKSLTFHQWTIIDIWSHVDAHAHYLQGKNKPWKLQGNDGIDWIMLGDIIQLKTLVKSEFQSFVNTHWS